MKCSRCGSSMNAAAPFCTQCGQMSGVRAGGAGGPRGVAGGHQGLAPSSAMAMQPVFASRATSTRPARRGGAVAAIWILGAVCAVLAAGAGLQSAGLLPSLPGTAAGLGQAGTSSAPSMTRQGLSQGDTTLNAAGALLPDGALRLAADADLNSTLGAQGGGTPPVLDAQGQSTPPMLNAEGSQGPPLLSSEQPGMPEGVRGYLEHVRRCENQRMQMAASQVAEAVGMLTDLQSGANIQGLFDEEGPQVEGNQPTRRVTESAGAMRGGWEGLVRSFNSVPPPAECAAIRSYYDQVIRETGIMILEITNAVEQASNDRQQALRVLMGLQGRSSSRIDRPARETDALIQSLCDHYRTRKWFAITADVGGGLLSK